MSRLKFTLKWPLIVDRINQRENKVFFKRPRTLKGQTFPKSCGENTKKISSFEKPFHGKVLFFSQLETKPLFSECM